MPRELGTPTGTCDMIINSTNASGATVRWRFRNVSKGFNMTIKSYDAMARAEALMKHIRAKKKIHVTYSTAGSICRVTSATCL